MTGYDWDALAPHWHLFEDRGFADTLVSALVRERVPAPVLVVGAGLGRYAAALRDQVGQVVAVDRSPRMAARAVAAHRLPFIVAEARQLPFAESAFATVVCASGVVEGMSGEDRASLLRELDRVAEAGFYLAAFVIRDGAQTVDVHAAIRGWEGGAIANHAFDEVARTLGGTHAAATLLSRAMPKTEPAIAERMLIESAAGYQLSVRRVDDDEPRGVALWRFLGA
jgi:ubiquinone/menaquinone biosynthesis C-methylase UbiE